MAMVDVEERKILLKASGCWGYGYALIPLRDSNGEEADRPEDFVLCQESGKVYARKKNRGDQALTKVVYIDSRYSEIVEQAEEKRVEDNSRRNGYQIIMETILFPEGVCVSAEGEGPLRRYREIMFTLLPGAYIIVNKRGGGAQEYVLYMNKNGKLIEQESRDMDRLEKMAKSPQSKGGMLSRFFN
ncbi:MAG: hypothetical protein ACM3UU_00350 [Ignavibacteriales bacterium]